MVAYVSDRQSIAAPAKINLSLRVLGRRDDGFHDIESVATKITLYDGIDVLGGSGPAISIECDNSAIPTDSQNLAWQAAALLSREFHISESLTIRLFKRIPALAGLGGGSSNAAAMLTLLNKRWRLDLDNDQLRGLAQQLGSDVPFFLMTTSSAVMRGRGEQLQAVDLPWNGWLVLCFPPFGVPTAPVYANWHKDHVVHGATATACLDTHVRHSTQLDELLFNDLQGGIYRVEPRMKVFREQLARSSGRSFHITGSGSTLFACCDTHDEAVALSRSVPTERGVSSRIARVLTPSDHK